MTNRELAAQAVAEYRASKGVDTGWARSAEYCDALAQAKRDELATTGHWNGRKRVTLGADVAALERAARLFRQVAAEREKR